MLKISLLLLFSFSSLAMYSAQTSPKQGSTGKKQDVFTIVADAYEPYFFKDNATDVVCAKWGIKFCYFWRHNCVFAENAARDSLRKQIHITDSIAKVRFGSNWKAKFDKDVERHNYPKLFCLNSGHTFG